MKLSNKKEKWIFFLTLGLLLLLASSLSGCSLKERISDSQTKKINIITTVFPAYDFVREIGKEYVEVSLLLPPGVESHSYEPTPEDIINISNSDGFIYVGGESDTWINTLLKGSLSEINPLKLMECVSLVEEEAVNKTSAQEEEAEYDEHVWTSPENAILIVESITKMLCQIDPEHAAQYEINSDAYLEKLKKLDEDFKEVVDEGKRDTLIFGDRFPFRYFVEEYGLNYEAAFPGCSSETEPSAATLTYLVDKIKKENISVVFYLELSNHKIADVLAETCGIKTAMFHSCHNISKEELESGETYLSLMNKNLEVLKEALQ